MFWNSCVGIHMYSTSTYDVMKSYLTLEAREFIMAKLHLKKKKKKENVFEGKGP